MKRYGPSPKTQATPPPPPKTSNCPPPQTQATRAVFSLDHKMSTSCIYSKRPLQIPQKSGFNHKASKFRFVAPHYVVFFHYWGETTPCKAFK